MKLLEPEQDCLPARMWGRKMCGTGKVPPDILHEIACISKDSKGKIFSATAGPTAAGRSGTDLTNHSTGKMGYAIALVPLSGSLDISPFAFCGYGGVTTAREIRGGDRAV